MTQTVSRATANAIQKGIAAAEEEEYLLALNILSEAYAVPSHAAMADGLSYYGLCVALVQRKFKGAIDLGRKAIELQFYNANHYVNLARIYVAAGNRKKGVETIEQGLRILPDDERLIAMREELGRRARPPVPFLSRSHPINKVIGRARHVKKPAPKIASKDDGDQRDL